MKYLEIFILKVWISVTSEKPFWCNTPSAVHLAELSRAFVGFCSGQLKFFWSKDAEDTLTCIGNVNHEVSPGDEGAPVTIFAFPWWWVLISALSARRLTWIFGSIARKMSFVVIKTGAWGKGTCAVLMHKALPVTSSTCN